MSWGVVVGFAVGLAYALAIGSPGPALVLGPVAGVIAALIGARRDPRD
jgi:hypothetical protein